MAIYLKTSQAEMSNRLNADMENIIAKLLKMLMYIGERCISEARTSGNYTDRTGNLRGSIGYVVLRNGVVQNMNAPMSKSKRFIEELIPKYSKGIVLVVVAGMNYAAYVEAKNYNVLASSELEAEKLVNRLLLQIGFNRK